jgi:hypothetical protein
MAEDAASRLIQDEIAQGFVTGDPAGLLPYCCTWRWRYASNNYVANLTLGMATYDMHDL